MGEPFAGIDAYCWQVSRQPDVSSPDEALDWVFMMHERDWLALEAVWPVRPAAWREACAYILGQGPPEPCRRLLEVALQDPELAVAAEAAVGYAALVVDEGKVPRLPAHVRARLAELHALTSGRNMKVVGELLRQVPVEDRS